MNYILVDRKPVVEEDVIKWARWFETNDRHIGKDKINDATISTIFLSLDHAYDGKPILFETMIFGGKFDGYQERYHTIEEAREGHKKAIEMVKENK
jgi:hypothetical protein